MIGATLAGTVAYFSDRAVIDEWGLTDRTVARQLGASKARGHNKRAPREYLIRRGVNFQIEHPWIHGCRRKAREETRKLRRPRDPLVFMRVGRRECMRLEYVVQTPELTKWMCDRPKDFIMADVRCPGRKRRGRR